MVVAFYISTTSLKIPVASHPVSFNRYVVVSHCGFIYISLITNDVKPALPRVSLDGPWICDLLFMFKISP